MIIIKCFGLKFKIISKYINDSLLYVVQYMMYYISQYMFLYNILSMKFRWVRQSPFSLSSKSRTRFRRLWCRDILGGRKRCRRWVATEMHLKNLSSALSHRSSKLVKSPGHNPALMLRLMNAFIRPLTSRWRSPTRPAKRTSDWL